MKPYRVALLAGAVSVGVLFACVPMARQAPAGPPSTTVGSGAASSRQADYLDIRFRQEVEALKRDIALSPTTLVNWDQRATLFWRWGNAAARAGHELNPAFSSLLSRRPNFAQSGEAVLARAFGNIDDMIRELAWREANPGGIGVLRTTTPGPFVADSYATISQTYEVGDVPVVPGGGVLFTPYIYIGGIAFQTDDPAKDNYLSVTASRPDVKFQLGSQQVGPIMSGAITGAPRDRPFFQLVEGRLEKGDTVTVTLGDKSGGSKGYLVPNFQTSGLRMKVWIRHADTTPNVVLPEIQFPVIGLPEAASVRAFAPSVMATGECAKIYVRTEDRYFNRSTAPAPGYSLKDGATTLARLAPGGGDVQIVDNICFRTSGIQRLQVVSDDGKLSAVTNPVLVEDKPASRIFWGETHGHSGFAEGNGTVKGYYTFARDDARLDFATLSEHDLWMDDGEWEALRKGARDFSRDGEFVAFLGYEWTQQSAFGGHHNVIFRQHEGAKRVPVQEAPTLEPLYARLKTENREKDVVVIPHAHMAGDFKTNDPAIERMVEIVSNHGTFEWLGKAYLGEGHRIGFLGGSDSHTEHPGLRVLRRDTPQSDFPGGLSAVYAGERTRDSIFDALHARLGYATNGAKIVLRSSVNGSTAREIPAAPVARIEGLAAGTAPIASITLVKNGRDIETRDFTALATPPSRSGLLRLRLFSESDPKGHLVPSRETRNWTASLAVSGAKVTAVTADGHSNIYTESLARSADDPNRIDFNLRTHGAPKDILIALDGIGRGASVKFEGSSGLGYARTLNEIEPFNASFALSDIIRAPATRPSGEKFPEDTFDLRFVAPVTERDRSFTFEDRSAKAGDYYYVRILQADGGMAWSSATWMMK
jgi:hypothetical protein